MILKDNSLICILILILSLISNISFTNSSNIGTDSVIELNADSFNQYVYNQKAITLVDYYLNWCSHCITFAKTWKQFAKDIGGWDTVVRVAAIDCAADALNQQFCRSHRITRFPRLKLFRTYSQRNRDFGLDFETKDRPTELRTQLIDWLLKSNDSSSLNLNINPNSIASKNELFNAFPVHSEKHNLIFLEKHPKRLGVEIILDFSSFREYINIIRVYDKTGSLTQQLFPHSVRLPALIYLHTNQSIELIASAHTSNEELLRQEFGNKIKNLLNINKYESNVITITDDIKAMNTSKPVMPRTPLPLSLADLYNTLRWSLHKEVTRYQTLNSTQVLVLKKYFSVVYKYFPFDNENVRRFFKRMKLWFANKTKSIKIEDFKAAMKISDGYLPPIVQWRHCSGSKSNLRGYQCGLWSLFHVLTVKEYTMNTSQTAHQVLDLMRDFIINFLSCEKCAKHFEKTSRGLSAHLNTPESSVLWLWRIHNQVNQRTKGSDSEDPYYPKLQYPTVQMCGQCYESNNEFNETNVLRYLIETYDQKTLTKSAAYFTEQKILSKNSVSVLFVNPFVICIFIFSMLTTF